MGFKIYNFLCGWVFYLYGPLKRLKKIEAEYHIYIYIYIYIYIHIYTGLFISHSGISELDCATTKTGTAERSISIGRESLQFFFCTRDLGVLPGSTARG